MSTVVVPNTANTGSSPHATTLDSLGRGARARITAIRAERGEQLARRLADLGLEPGRDIEVGRRAPMGDPTTYRVADYTISLRRRDASLVEVEAEA